MSLENILVFRLNKLFNTDKISIRQERGVIKCFYLGENKTDIRYCTKIFEDLVFEFKTYSEDDMLYYYANKIVEYVKKFIMH